MADISDGSPAIESATMESEAGETFLLRCKAKLPRDVPYKFCLHDNFFSNAFRLSELSVFCEVPAMSPESGQRRIASTTKNWQNSGKDVHIPHIPLNFWSAGDITRQLQYSEFLRERHPSSPSRSQHPVRDLCAPSISFPRMTCLVLSTAQKTICAIFCWNSQSLTSLNMFCQRRLLTFQEMEKARSVPSSMYQLDQLSRQSEEWMIQYPTCYIYISKIIMIHIRNTQYTLKWNAHQCQKRHDI